MLTTQKMKDNPPLALSQRKITGGNMQSSVSGIGLEARCPCVGKVR